jgi:transcriptional regulator with GAF, ATPase, and Fis domain
MRDVERARLHDALRRAAETVTGAAERLGLPRNTLRYRLDRHGLALEARTRPDGGEASGRLGFRGA